MDRAERNTSAQGSDFSIFQTTVMLEEQVRLRTAELEAALRENEKMNRALRESEAKFRGLVSQSLVGIVLIEDGKFSYSNAKFDEIFGYSSDEVRRMGPLQVAAEVDRALVAENIDRRLSGETDHLEYTFRGLRKNQAVIDIECHSSVMHVGERQLLISLLMDISERTRAERAVQVLQEELRELSTRDALTGLHNRRFLEESFSRELLLAERTQVPVSVIMGDLDHFKAINDRCGHLAGDEVLRVFGSLMKHHSRASDITCRYGGEEFLLILPGLTEEGAIERAELLRLTMEATRVGHGAAQIAVTASFGVACFPRHGRTIDELIAAADSALYSAKAGGRNRVGACPEPRNVGDRLATGERATVGSSNSRA
ncbi:MAG: GGDEF domain-containing protein [Propionibacteriaceae bacterium]|nr:GGDEF domain-containing protein [Propionibacteriaceae bacterium]